MNIKNTLIYVLLCMQFSCIVAMQDNTGKLPIQRVPPRYIPPATAHNAKPKKPPRKRTSYIRLIEMVFDVDGCPVTVGELLNQEEVAKLESNLTPTEKSLQQGVKK